MSANRELNYHLYTQKMAGFVRQPFGKEMEIYAAVQSGDVEKVRRIFDNARKDFTSGQGTLSNDPVRNIRYHMIVSVAVIERICVEAGLLQDEAYTLGDIYIRRADICNDQKELLDLFEEMEIDFAEHMKELRKNDVISVHIRKCIDYIYDNLHESLSVGLLAEVVGLNTTYLSKLFVKETGSTLKQFIINARVSTAENLLKYSDYPYSEIAFSLGFSSQSAFISVFKRITGKTPKQYREQYLNHFLDN